MNETALQIAARNLAKARATQEAQLQVRNARLEERKVELQKYLNTFPALKEWALDIKEHFGGGVRVRRFGK
jgi:hypothetical protein